MKKYLSVVLLCLGIILVIFGIATGEIEVVFEKATRICLECVGIG